MYPKYHVEKLNGKPVGPCFVLEFDDPHARAAVAAYADSCEGDYPALAADLRRTLAEIESKDAIEQLTECIAGFLTQSTQYERVARERATPLAYLIYANFDIKPKGDKK